MRGFQVKSEVKSNKCHYDELPNKNVVIMKIYVARVRQYENF
jgi:hypothetical protein